jgi:hypothetical protein
MQLRPRINSLEKNLFLLFIRGTKYGVFGYLFEKNKKVSEEISLKESHLGPKFLLRKTDKIRFFLNLIAYFLK